MKESRMKEMSLIGGISIFTFFVCIGISLYLLPQHCNLFSSNISGGFMCDGIDILNPKPCPVCQDRMQASIATIVVGFGFISIFLPLLIYGLRDWFKKPIEQKNLFSQ